MTEPEQPVVAVPLRARIEIERIAKRIDTYCDVCEGEMSWLSNSGTDEPCLDSLHAAANDVRGLAALAVEAVRLHPGDHDFDGRDWCRLCRNAERAAVEAVRPETDIDESLDAAWNEAAAVLPKRWLGPNLFAYYPKGWEATAHHEDETPGQGRSYRSTGACYGETPAEALHALAIELRRRATPLAERPE